jgi:hypothetical protein
MHGLLGFGIDGGGYTERFTDTDNTEIANIEQDTCLITYIGTNEDSHDNTKSDNIADSYPNNSAYQNADEDRAEQQNTRSYNFTARITITGTIPKCDGDHRLEGLCIICITR